MLFGDMQRKSLLLNATFVYRLYDTTTYFLLFDATIYGPYCISRKRSDIYADFCTRHDFFTSHDDRIKLAIYILFMSQRKSDGGGGRGACTQFKIYTSRAKIHADFVKILFVPITLHPQVLHTSPATGLTRNYHITMSSI